MKQKDIEKLQVEVAQLTKDKVALSNQLRKIQGAARSMVIQNLHLEGMKGFTLAPLQEALRGHLNRENAE